MNIPSGLLPHESVLHLEKRFILHKSIIQKELAEVDPHYLEQVLKNLTLIDVRNYYHAVHAPDKKSPFLAGKDTVPYGGRQFDHLELISLIDASLEFYLTTSRYDKLFCEGLSAYLQSASRVYALTCNSGSSANLLALSALTSPKLGDSALEEGDEVITVAAGFPTTITPIVQNRLIPVFVDIEIGTYNIDANKIEEALSDKTKAIFLAHTLGIPFDLDKILDTAERHGL
ncbi:MAG: DegT/DnrJ/EryC1/StrS family aminotransferase, partial [Deltaproteobacteria bacterium]|nr:DegT/DnrJ/EryC1/StrS family aminotransferase [Deltaproteobacteria bacterium]